MAAPHVAGVAALLLAYNPNLTTAQIKAAIMDNVDEVPALNGLCTSGGRLNAYLAVACAPYGGGGSGGGTTNPKPWLPPGWVDLPYGEEDGEETDFIVPIGNNQLLSFPFIFPIAQENLINDQGVVHFFKEDDYCGV